MDFGVTLASGGRYDKISQSDIVAIIAAYVSTWREVILKIYNFFKNL